MLSIYVRLQVVSGPRDVDLSVPSVACGRLEAASAEHAGASRKAIKNKNQKQAVVLVSIQCGCSGVAIVLFQ